jgi:glycosyltransferase 2 family protein
MQKKKLISSILFFIVGVILFLIVYRNFNLMELKKALSEVHFGWIILSVILGLASHFIRALRWKMLINTLGYQPKTVNLFLSVIVLYFTNLVIPRGGEISRCAVISKYENTPFVKLLGTVFIERVTDMCAFVLIFVFVLIWHFSIFRTIVNYPEFDFSNFHLKLLTILLIFIVIGIIVLLVIKFQLFKKVVSFEL